MTKTQKGKGRFLSGNEAAAEAVRLCGPQVIAAYPITPQTTLMEKLSEFVAAGEMSAPCKLLLVESEHSAMAAVMGAAMMGSRVFTATSSQGLLYMCEMLNYVSGSRFPVVMANANRGTATPWTIFGDQRDSFAMRDSGWIQFYVESGQEALDTILQAYRIAELPDVMLPVMVNIDGFTLPHTYDLVQVPEQKAVDAFLPAFKTFNKLSLEAPKCMSFAYGPDYHLESRCLQQKVFDEAVGVIERVDEEFYGLFGRRYHGLADTYRCEDAELVLAVTGSAAGTTRVVVDKLRAEGKKVGLIKVRCLRPFPAKFFASLNSPQNSCKVLGVLDRNISFGLEGGLYTDAKASMYRPGAKINTLGFVAGLGGHDVSKADIEVMFGKLANLAEGKPEEEHQFIGMRWA
ncbi:pyruvate ferredoxin oxidoreductase subunit alpha [Synergistales bacterium]|nr:pyruvate ferredoxin oxidoreductase subunit alpha [Synergistales bacterium]